MSWQEAYREFILSRDRPDYRIGWICHPMLHGNYVQDLSYVIGTDWN